MEAHDEKRQMTTKDNHIQIELTAMMLDDEETNGQRQVIDRDVDAQAELTSIMIDDDDRNYQECVISKDVKINTDSPQTFHGKHSNLNGQETLDQKQVVTTVEDSDDTLKKSRPKNRRVVDVHIEKPNLTTTNIINHIKAELGPIAGYAKEPLLPLYKACAPLENMIYDLSTHVKIALQETPEQPSDGLTIDESAVIRLYTMEWSR